MSSTIWLAIFTVIIWPIALYLNRSPQHGTTKDDDNKTIFKLYLRPISPGDDQKCIDELKEDTQKHVRTAFMVDSKVEIKIWSIVIDSSLKAHIGTLSFSTIPDSIETTRTRTTRGTLPESKVLPAMNLELSLNFDGLTPLFSGSIEQQSLDILAVHGLGGHPIGSFTAEDDDNMWLRDDLPCEMPNCSIYTFGYPSKVPESKSFASLYDLGKPLKTVLQELILNNAKENHQKRIVLIGHSLGGLMIKEAISDLYRLKKFDDLALIRGILFFGTPSLGMNTSKLLAMAEGGPNEDLIKSLSYNSETLQRQSMAFETAFMSPRLKHLEVFSYYETVISPTYKQIEGKWKKEGLPELLVDRNSATKGRPWDEAQRDALPINRNHANLVRYVRNDDVYLHYVKPTLEGLLKPSQQPGLFHRTGEQNACLFSIRFDELDFRFDDIDEALVGTCTWLHDNPQYKKWSLRQKRLLLLKGHRTTGKSTLMKHALKELKSDTKLVVMSHFFWKSGTVDLQRNACGFFRSLMYQFLPYSFSSLAAAMPKYRDMKNKPFWHPKWMKEFLKKEIPQACKSQSLRIVIIVDAVDECDEKDRTDIMTFLGSLSESPEGDLRICVSYSPGDISGEADIDMALHNDKDIAKYVQDKLSKLPKPKLSMLPETKLFKSRSILGNIQERAQGMFLWAEIACNNVIKMDGKGEPAGAILEAIESLPKELDDMFMELLEDMTPLEAQKILKLFRWICFARYPLTIAELRYAIMFDPGMEENSIKKIHENPNFRKEDIDMIRAVINQSKGLAKIIDDGESLIALCLCDRKVHFIHESVREFLLDRGFESLLKISGNGSGDAASSGHSYLAWSCIKHLAMEDPFVGTSMEEMRRVESSFPLLRYAVTSWIFHTEQAESATNPQAESATNPQAESATNPQDDLLKLFNWPSPDIINTWVDLRRFLDHLYPWNDRLNLGTNLLHISAKHGLVSLLTAILNGSKFQGVETIVEHQTNHSQDADEGQNKAVISSTELTRFIEVEDSRKQTPLWYAARANKVAATKLLLKHNANPNPKDRLFHETPLRQAAQFAGGEMMKLFSDLLAENFQVTENILIAALRNVYYGAKVMEILLEKGLPKVEITLVMVEAAAENHRSGSKALKILIQDLRLETNALEEILEKILRFSNAGATRVFLQALSPVFSTRMLVTAASNRNHGADVTAVLFNFYKWTGDITKKMVITKEMISAAFENEKQGWPLMQLFRRHGSMPLGLEAIRGTAMAKNSWAYGEEWLSMFRQAKMNWGFFAALDTPGIVWQKQRNRLSDERRRLQRRKMIQGG